MNCQHCKQPVAAAARFCQACGTPVPEKQASSELRQLTVMFCDLVESTHLAAQLDPEDLSEAIGAYQQACRTIIEPLRGTIAQYLGDGVLVYFGYPRAHEDSPIRAVHAALRIIEEMPAVSAQTAKSIPLLRERPLEARVGIHTGPVVIASPDEAAEGEQLALGATPNVAARLQAEAAPGSVVISAATERLVRGAFELEALGERSLRGLGAPYVLFRALEARDGGGRREASPGAAVAPLVGRAAELAYLTSFWERAHRGEGCGVLVQGEAGIGKSRLIAALRHRLSGEFHEWIELRGSPYHEQSPFHPLIECVERVLGLSALTDDDARRASIEASLESAGVSDPASVAAFESLFGLPERENAPPLAPPQKRRLLLEAVAAWLRQSSSEGSKVIVVDDLHWVDPSTREVLELLVASVSLGGLLLLFGSRYGPSTEWTQSGIGHLHLPPLNGAATAEIAANLAGQAGLDPEMLEAIVAKTDGVPIFVEEVTRIVLQSGEISGVPATLRDLLAARFDQLGPSRHVAQLASVLGREFSFEMLDAISPTSADELASALSELAAAGLVVPTGGQTRGRYTFRHALLQDTAYESQLKRQRRELHGEVARALAGPLAASAAAKPEVVAMHFQRGGLPADAIQYFRRAAEAAEARLSQREEAAHRRAAISLLLEELPEDRERDLLEIDLRLSLSRALFSIDGIASSDAMEVLGRARELCVSTGETMQLYGVLLGRSFHALGVSQNEAVLELRDELETLVEESGSPELRPLTGVAAGGALGMLGRYREALELLEPTVAALEEQTNGDTANPVHASVVMAQTYITHDHLMLGDIDRARAVKDLVLEIGGRPENAPHSRVQSLVCATNFTVMTRDATLGAVYADELMALGRAEKHPIALSIGGFSQGWLKYALGDLESALDLMAAAIEEAFDHGTTMRLSAYQGMAGRVALESGDIDDAEMWLKRAFQQSVDTGEAYFLPELHRHSAAVHRAAGRIDAARESLDEASRIASVQSARILALRAAVDMARLEAEHAHGSSGHRAATEMLRRSFDGFEAGLESPDLLEAANALDAVG